MKLLSLEIGERFRSLDKGFRIDFRSGFNNPDEETDVAFDFKSLSEFQPFCFAGLNGSGKSNVLEALSSIFYHLECCVAKFKPLTFESHFRRDECNPDAYILEYLIGRNNMQVYSLSNYYKITIIKEVGTPPKLFRQSFPFKEKPIQESLEPPKRKESQEPAPGKIYLPDVIVGYSSGENEILSIPFRKSRLINFDKFKEDYKENRPLEEPENSLIYIDAEMSQAVLLACLLYENDKTLKPLRKELGIIGLRSFRMNIKINMTYENGLSKQVILLDHIKDKLENLKKCATSWNVYDQVINGAHAGIINKTLILDFFVDSNTKKAFKEYFSTAFDLFRFLQILYELNAVSVSETTKEDVYKSKGFYTDWKIPSEVPERNIFYFEDYYIIKYIESEPEPKLLLLRELSDGEHQFLHSMGICLMLKERRSILLLDEPETHFNPNWRAKFIDLINESILAGGGNNLQKEVLLTSHSPFIISDCLPNNVIFFQKENNTAKTIAIKASEKGIKTYGSDVNYIMKNLFDTNLVSSKSSNELQDIINRGNLNELLLAIDSFGESSQKQFLFKKIYELKHIDDDNND